MEELQQLDAKNAEYARDVGTTVREVLQEQHMSLEALLIKQYAEMSNGDHFYQLELRRAQDQRIARLQLELSNARTDVDRLRQER